MQFVKKTRPTVNRLISICLGFILAASIPSSAATTLQDSNDPGVWTKRGLELSNAGNYQEAVEAYRRAIKLKSDHAEAHFRLGDAYFQLKKYDQAIEAYKKAVRYDPKLSTAFNNLGTAFTKIGDPNKAVEAYREAIRLDPKFPGTYFSLGATYWTQGDQAAALVQYRLLKTIDPPTAARLYAFIYQPGATAFREGEKPALRLNVSVADPKGVNVKDLTEADFGITDEGAPQTLTFFSKQDVPLYYGVVVDNTGSIRPHIMSVIEAGRAIVNGHRTADEGMITRFTGRDNIQVIQEFTRDPNSLVRAMEGMLIEPGQTALWDAVYVSAQTVAQYRPNDDIYHRRAIVLITDGGDRSSYYKFDQLQARLRALDIQVYVLAIAVGEDEQDRNRFLKESATALLTKLANETGGQAFFPGSEAEFKQVAGELLDRVRNQYVIGYDPVRSAPGEQFHTVTVSVVDGPNGEKRKTQTRTGYIVPEKP